MNCTDIQDRLIDYIHQELNSVAKSEIEEHLQKCSSCRKTLNELQLIFTEIDSSPIEIPSKHLKDNFETMLAREIYTETKKNTLLSNKKHTWKTALQIAATLILMISSFYFGKTQQQELQEVKLSTLNDEKTTLKKEMTISLFENTSASKRLLAVNYAETLEKPGNEILKALIDKMYYDEHTNVRIAAAEALAKFSSSEMVRKALIHALEKEEDPNMLIELIQILVNIQEKRAVPSLERLLKNQETPDYVKDQAKIGLPNLI